MSDRNPDGTFAEGNPGGPGRPKSARNQLSEAFIRALSESFEEHGVETIDELRREQPKEYVATIGKLMPKLMELSGPDGGDIPINGRVTFVKSDKST